MVDETLDTIFGVSKVKNRKPRFRAALRKVMLDKKREEKLLANKDSVGEKKVKIAKPKIIIDPKKRLKAKSKVDIKNKHIHSMILEKAWDLFVASENTKTFVLTKSTQNERYNPKFVNRHKMIFAIPQNFKTLDVFKLDEENTKTLCKFAIKLKSPNPKYLQLLTKRFKKLDRK